MSPSGRRAYLGLAGAVSFLAALPGCGGGSTGGSVIEPAPTRALSGLPPNHGLDPALGTLTIPSGRSERHGSVEIACPADGPACVLNVAGDGAVHYRLTGGRPAVTTARLPFPLREPTTGSPHFSIRTLPRAGIADARHMPVYHDDHGGTDRRLFAGIDQGTEQVGRLPVVEERGDIEIRHGSLTDGVGRALVLDYLVEAVRSDRIVRRYDEHPRVRIIGPASARDTKRVAVAVQLVNAALPASAKMSLDASQPDFSLRDTVDEKGLRFVSGQESDNVIHVEFVPDGEFHSDAGGTTWNHVDDREDRIENSYIQINQGSHAYRDDRLATILLAHEIGHALGFYGPDHVSPDFDTIMEAGNAIYALRQGIPQPWSLLYPVDREALQAFHGHLERGEEVTTLGAWANTSLHVHGNGPHAGFGVALRNGYAEPWAYGYLPDTDLADNRRLAGRATWTGALLGLTPQAASVAGDATIAVELDTMAGRADFTNLETWGPRMAPGQAGTGGRWHDGDLGYSIAVRGNTFRETGGDDGLLTGIFVGGEHQGATGTLERDDLTAAFGASR